MFKRFKNFYLFLDYNEKKNFFITIFFIILLNISELLSFAIFYPIISYFEKFDQIINFLEILNIKFLLNYFNINEIIYLFFFIIFILFTLRFLFTIISNLLINYFLYLFQKKKFDLVTFNFIKQDYIDLKNRKISFFLKNLLIENQKLGFLHQQFIFLFNDIFFIILIILATITYNYYLSIFFLIFIFVIIFLNKIIIKNKLQINISNLHDEKKVNYLNNFINGIKEIKFLDKEDVFMKNISIHNDYSIKANRIQSFVSTIPRAVIEYLFLILFLFFLVFFSIKTTTNNSQLTLSIILLALIIRVVPNLSRIIISINNIYSTYPSIKDIIRDSEYIKSNNRIKKNHFYKKFSFQKKLEIKNLQFSYTSKNKIFDDANIVIRKGDKIAISGSSGAGKTTLLDIISGLIPIEKSIGKITLDNYDFNKVVFNWKRSLAYVQQKIFLLNDSIKKNIIFSTHQKNISAKRLKTAIRIAQIDIFLKESGYSLDTNINDFSYNLSQGQKQRIAIARAIYANPDVLILDEATSSLDEKSERFILDSIFKEFKKKTIIFVSHKKNLFKYCNKIFLFKNKKFYKI